MDIYGQFNLLIRRKSKENNFASILRTIRSLILDDEDSIIPSKSVVNSQDWLTDLFLGYGNPVMATSLSSTNQLSCIFPDTFLHIKHVFESFQKGKFELIYKGTRIQLSHDNIEDYNNKVHGPYQITFNKGNSKMIDIDYHTDYSNSTITIENVKLNRAEISNKEKVNLDFKYYLT